VGADAVFANEGFKAENTVSGNKFTNNTNLNYIRVPLKLSYFFGGLGDKFRPKLYAGPSLGFLVGGKTKFETENLASGAVVKTETDSKNNYKSFDFGVMGGIGFNYRIGTATWLNLDLNYTNGLTDVTKGESNWNANRNYGIAVGVAFPLGTIKQAK